MLAPGPALALSGLLLVATAACSVEPTSPNQPTASVEPTTDPMPLGDYDTSTVTVVRSGFCGRVTDQAIAAALGGDAGEVSDKVWAPGERLPGTRDIGNEFGCAWRAKKSTARAWVFAPPVTAERAAGLVSEVVGPRCEPVRPAPPLGAPSVARSCDLDGARLVGFSGLVGDAWVSCEVDGLAGAEAEDVDLVGEWCVAVLEAMRSA